MRKDSDLLGDLWIPDEVYYGAQTLRTLQLFEPSKETINQFPGFIYSMGGVKKACAITNMEIGMLDRVIGKAICEACDEVMEGKLTDQFVLDMLSGNDFAPIHMNFNEVIACRANEILTGVRGYSRVHPNTHVNMGLSTCDSTYTAARFALYLELEKTLENLLVIRNAYQDIADKYRDEVKVAHTCFQDASPISIGQFYDANVSFFNRQISSVNQVRLECLEHSIGSTVIGTGLGVFEGFDKYINKNLRDVFGFETRFSNCPFDDRQYSDFFLRASACMKSIITGASKMARDIRIMSSGPRAGFQEITIAPVQTGSSFFPGKVNPSLCELINIAAYQICGYDASITMAVEAGELDCSPWYPVFTVNTLNEASLINRCLPAFAKKCVATIQTNAQCNKYKAERSLGMASVASAVFGYKNAIKIEQYAEANNLPVKDAIVDMKLMDKEKAYRIFDPLTLTDVNKSSELMSDSVEKERY